MRIPTPLPRAALGGASLAEPPGDGPGAALGRPACAPALYDASGEAERQEEEARQ